MNSTEIYWLNDICYHHDLRIEKEYHAAFDEILEEQNKLREKEKEENKDEKPNRR